MQPISELAELLRQSRGLAAKADIAKVVDRLNIAGGTVLMGDDCAAIPDGDGYTLFAIEGFMNEFVAADPFFAGWCSVMVNISDIASMGGWPVAVVDALWATSAEQAAPILAGMRAASEAYGVPIVGGHSNLKTTQAQLAVSILGRAKHLLTSFDAEPGDVLVMVVDLRGQYREPFNNWQAALDAPAERLREDLRLLPELAARGLSRAAKDISQAGIIGTTAMLAECSGVGAVVDLTTIPKPDGVSMARWLQTFPSYGYLIAAKPFNVADILALFSARDLAVASIGKIIESQTVSISDGTETHVIVDFAEMRLLGVTPVLEGTA